MKLSYSVLSGCIAMALAANAEAKTKKTDFSKMNILFIAVEDWSTDAIGCYGNKMVKTPHLDALAKKGVMFTRAYAQAVVCNPSRASITTGLRPDAVKVYNNGDDFDKFAPEGIPFIADLLKKNGAHTAQLGKLMHKWHATKRYINTFDQIEFEKPIINGEGKLVDIEDPQGYYKGLWRYRDIVGTVIPAQSSRDWEYVPDMAVDARMRRLAFVEDSLLKSGKPDSWEIRKPFQQLEAEQIGDCGFVDENSEDGILARVAASMIGDYAKEGKQFFLNVGLYAPHTPLLEPKKYMDLYDTALIQLPTATRDKDINVPEIAVRNGQNYDVFNGMYPEFGPTPERQKMAIQLYYASSTYVDAQIGLVLDALKKNKLDKNTIVILWADHGFQLGEHGCWSKFTLFEQSTKVPLIVYAPGAKGNGKPCDEIVELVDMLPTMCDMWNIKKDERFEGLSFLPLLHKPNQSWKKAAFTIVPKPLNGRSVRTKQYKYAEYYKDISKPDNGGAALVRELYDLTIDPKEQNNLAVKKEYEKVCTEMQAMLKAGWKGALPK
jgi:arylsulfatase A-like enzyme